MFIKLAQMLVFLLAIVNMLSMRSYGSYVQGEHVQGEHSTDFPKGSGIPKIIHLSSRVYWYKNMSMPNIDKSLRRSCIYLNPDWEVKLWSDEMNDKLVSDHYPFLQELYDSYRNKIKKVDMVRYLYLHKYLPKCLYKYLCIKTPNTIPKRFAIKSAISAER